MRSFSASWFCGLIRYRGLLCAGVAFVATSLASAATLTNTVSGAKFTERFTRTVRFVHAGPVVGDFALLNDRGTFTLQASLSLEGFDLSLIDGFTQVGVSLSSLAGTEYFNIVQLRMDPRFEDGDRSAKITTPGEFGGRTQVVSTISIKIDRVTETLRVKITERLIGATVAPDSELEREGESALADDLVGLPSQEVDQTLLVTVALGTSADTVTGETLLAVGGRVRTTPRTDPEIGTFNASTVVLGGVPAGTRP